MKKYKFVLKKVQIASVDVDWSSEETIGDVTDRLEKLSEEEIGFGAPTYHLEAISKEQGKIAKIIWKAS